MLNEIQAILREPALQFLRQALLVGVLVALCAALLGVSLVLKRCSMIGDGLSHVGFGALAVATALGLAPLYVSVPVTMVAAFGLLRLTERSKLKGDAAIALLSTTALALGIAVISFSSGVNTDLYAYMFGSLLAMAPSDVWVAMGLALVVLLLFVLFYQQIFAITFDSPFARATGVRAGFFNLLLAFLTAITIAVGMRLMGAMLISSLLIFPALSAMRVCQSFRTVTLCAALLSLFCFLLGVVGSYLASSLLHVSLATGAAVVLVNAAAFLVCSVVAQVKAQRAKRKPSAPAPQ